MVLKTIFLLVLPQLSIKTPKRPDLFLDLTFTYQLPICYLSLNISEIPNTTFQNNHPNSYLCNGPHLRKSHTMTIQVMNFDFLPLPMISKLYVIKAYWFYIQTISTLMPTPVTPSFPAFALPGTQSSFPQKLPTECLLHWVSLHTLDLYTMIHGGKGTPRNNSASFMPQVYSETRYVRVIGLEQELGIPAFSDSKTS